jgi:hypothetical protein
MLDFSSVCTICKSFKKMLKTEIDFGMKFFLVTLNGEVRDVGPNSEYPPVFQLVPFRTMSASDIHASVE